MGSDESVSKKMTHTHDAEFQLPPSKRQRVEEPARENNNDSKPLNPDAKVFDAQLVGSLDKEPSNGNAGNETEPPTAQRTWQKGEAPVKAE
jgi:hypothetical protein